MKQLLLLFAILFSTIQISRADICQTPMATASGTDNTNVTASVTDFTCVGANPIVGATLDATIGTQCTSWYWYDIVVNGVTVATQQCTQTAFDLTPYLPLTSVDIVSYDNPLDGIGDFVTLTAVVNLTYFPPCSNPPNFQFSNVTTSTSDLSWDPIGNATSYNVEWGNVGFAPGTGAELGSDLGVAGTTSQATGLTAGNSYEAYVQTDCGIDGVSTWAGPITFTTPFQPPLGVTCSTGFATYLFSNDLESNSGWTGDIGTGNAQWDFPVVTPGGNSVGTGPSAAASGTYYAEFEASGIVATTASMVTPMIDLTNANSQAELSFYMHAFGADIGTLNVGVGTSPTGPFTTVFSWSGQYQTSEFDPWEHIGVDITAYLGQQIYVEFNYGALTSGYEGDMAIDLVQVETCVTCPGPTNLSGIFTSPDMIFLDWTAGGTETAWNIEYGPTGFTPGTGTTVNVTSSPYTLTGVTLNSMYDIYIQADCGGGDQSALTGPITVSTLANDDVCNAQLVVADSTTTVYTNNGATTQIGEPGSTPNNTVWFKTVVPASGHVAIATCGEDFDTELEVFAPGLDCNDFGTFTSLGYADWNPWSCAGTHPAGIELCGLNAGDTLTFWIGSWSNGNTGTFPLTVWEIASNAGTGTLAEMCIADTVDLWPYITGYDNMSGYWAYPTNPNAIVNGSDFVAGNSTFAGDSVYYIISNVCESDTAAVAIDVYNLSSAGDDGSFTVCLNQPYDLYSGLAGTVDIGGTWYDPANNVTSSNQNAPNLPGQFNFDYITSNGFCPSDTSNVVVTVSMNCDWLDIEELYFSGVEVYPNPATQNVFISNLGSDEVFNYELTDAQGKVIATKENAINGTKITEIDLKNLDIGLYMIHVYNENAEKTFRIVKQ